MKISGYNKRRISTVDNDSRVAFDMNLELTDVTGSASFGISGFIGTDTAENSRKTVFNFKSGRVFDPEGRNVYSYQKDKNINLKGTFLTETYDYFINNDLICSLGKKEDYKIRNFFFDSDGCEIELNDLDVYGPTGALAMTELLEFDVSDDVDTTNQTLAFPNALTFNKKLDFVGSVLSGEVTIGSKFFEFDNSVSNINSLTDVPPAVGFVGRRDLRLIAQTNLTETAYPLEINFYTTFGNITKTALLIGGNPENPSGVKLSVLGDGVPLQSGSHSRLHSFDSSDGDKVSGHFAVNYSSEIATGDDSSLGLPYKIYLEHIEGDHSKQYSFLTGIKLSGSGLGYLARDDISRDITFRSGSLGTNGTAGSAGLAGSTFGNSIGEKAVGLISRYNNSHQTKMVEAHMSVIKTNLYTGDAAAVEAGEGGSSNYNIFKMQDGSVCTQRFNTADIVTLMPAPDGNSTKETPSGIAEIFSYTKPASDWKLFTGDADSDESTYIEHTATGKDSTPLRRHKFVDGKNEIFLGAILQSKQYFDADPMVYRLVVSGADGYTGNALITGTVMEHGQDDNYKETIPETPLLY